MLERRYEEDARETGRYGKGTSRICASSALALGYSTSRIFHRNYRQFILIKDKEDDV